MSSRLRAIARGRALRALANDAAAAKAERETAAKIAEAHERKNGISREETDPQKNPFSASSSNHGSDTPRISLGVPGDREKVWPLPLLRMMANAEALYRRTHEIVVRAPEDYGVIHDSSASLVFTTAYQILRKRVSGQPRLYGLGVLGGMAEVLDAEVRARSHGGGDAEGVPPQGKFGLSQAKTSALATVPLAELAVAEAFSELQKYAMSAAKDGTDRDRYEGVRFGRSEMQRFFAAGGKWRGA